MTELERLNFALIERFRSIGIYKKGDMATFLDYKSPYFSGIINGKEKITEQFLKTISDKLQINIDWILTGNGDMLHTVDYLTSISKMNPTGPIFEFSEGPGKSESGLKALGELHEKIYDSHISVKLVTTKARAGFAGAYYADEYLNDMPTILMEADHEYKGKYLAFEVDGDSMEPDYIKGDICICREVKRDLWQYKLHYNEWDFVIAHGTKGIMLKEIIDHNVETGDILCHSINTEEHPDFTLNLREVAFLYNVVEVRRSGKRKKQNRY